MTPYDAESFSAGQDCGTRIAGCVARLAALELMADARWWNRRSRRLMAGVLVAFAEEMEEESNPGAAESVGVTETARPILMPPPGLVVH